MFGRVSLIKDAGNVEGLMKDEARYNGRDDSSSSVG